MNYTVPRIRSLIWSNNYMKYLPTYLPSTEIFLTLYQKNRKKSGMKSKCASRKKKSWTIPSIPRYSRYTYGIIFCLKICVLDTNKNHHYHVHVLSITNPNYLQFCIYFCKSCTNWKVNFTLKFTEMRIR